MTVFQELSSLKSDPPPSPKAFPLLLTTPIPTIRSFFILYTSSLRYSTTTTLLNDRSFLKTSPGGPPTPKSVMISDLDLRDLHRNAFLTSLEDLRAQLLVEPYDKIEVEAIIKEMREEEREWTGMIPVEDVEEARRAVGYVNYTSNPDATVNLQSN
ncbi:hypothetical protein TrCOL_g7655 [Triparma columacea]|uniref:Uncharacterized protein n=1 Tax=Triparma columacea TaxID=722753 RepID=A0A9W7GC95_9STRA|nr:hypothetical protein TrCOL_g7655 [Triparma columacea]